MSQEIEAPTADEVLYAEGATCATLTPLIRAKIRELKGGGVLEIRTDDPSARVDIPAWSRLTGNELVSTVEEGAECTRFYVRKK